MYTGLRTPGLTVMGYRECELYSVKIVCEDGSNVVALWPRGASVTVGCNVASPD